MRHLLDPGQNTTGVKLPSPLLMPLDKSGSDTLLLKLRINLNKCLPPS